MQSSRLKNIIILILVLTNLFLLGSLAMRQTQERASQRQGAQELVALFAAAEITLDESLIPSSRAPEGRVLTRDAGLDRKVAQTLLGKDLTEFDRGGGLLGYVGGSGTALFQANGAFSATGPFPGGGDPETFCRQFCRSHDYDGLLFLLEEDGSGTATAVQQYDGYPVSRCTVTFTMAGGQVESVSGTHLPDTYTGVYTNPDNSAPISALTALTALLDARRLSGAVISEVTDVYPCYELQSSPAQPMILVPAWCVVTNLGEYYVNSYTREVTHN